MSDDPGAAALAYHLRTRHAPHAYARALSYMDWDTQPDPFRRYVGAPVTPLDRSPTGLDARYDAVIDGRLPTPATVDFGALSSLFLNSLALSAWKEAGDLRWSLRVNPSSGNLHPTEAYLVCGAIADVCDSPMVSHYNPLLHGLERRALLPEATWRLLAADLPRGAVIVGLTSIPVRESWKYGERAFRYCQHDLGHAIAGLSIAAAGLGWRVRLLDSVVDSVIADLLGIAGQPGAEQEIPECLLVVYPDGDFPLPQYKHFSMPTIPALTWAGAPAKLATDHHDWPIIDVVGAATRRLTPARDWQEHPPRPPCGVERESTVGTLVRQRRSAVEMDGATSLPRAAFLRTMRRLLPGAPPFDAVPWRPSVHPFVFVHRVVGLEPGLYALIRDTLAPDSFGIDGAWERVEADLPLYLIRRGDLRTTAQNVSCGQAIAADGAYALGMIGQLDAGLERGGAPFYRRAHWEAGMIGQVLYLEAESDRIRGTGIGCFYDEEMHRAIGLPKGSGWRTMYHFTVGGPIEDKRLRTTAPYAHLDIT